MTTMTIFSLALFSLLALPTMLQPLSLGLMLVIATLFMCVTSAILLSSWYAYILYLIYVGGLLVMFAYIAALSPNILFKKVRLSILVVLLVIFLFIFSWQFMDSSYLASYDSHFQDMKYFKMYSVEVVSPEVTSVLIGLGAILLLNLIVVAKICFGVSGTLRPFIA
uniref:NADH-ubiquinone oxidoreductase chain 6 n=1 Tax=Coralliophila richardi TaxID=2991502 RepID=A0A9E8G3H6_9CAEN|nr:NADH dehydrogenase subunit 6 [Coralliophila richardi]UZT26953.1 NADH dehydrogenase subunit 6 [Coralliophila richardi]